MIIHSIINKNQKYSQYKMLIRRVSMSMWDPSFFSELRDRISVTLRIIGSFFWSTFYQFSNCMCNKGLVNDILFALHRCLFFFPVILNRIPDVPSNTIVDEPLLIDNNLIVLAEAATGNFRVAELNENGTWTAPLLDAFKSINMWHVAGFFSAVAVLLIGTTIVGHLVQNDQITWFVDRREGVGEHIQHEAAPYINYEIKHSINNWFWPIRVPLADRVVIGLGRDPQGIIERDSFRSALYRAVTFDPRGSPWCNDWFYNLGEDVEHPTLGNVFNAGILMSFFATGLFGAKCSSILAKYLLRKFIKETTQGNVISKVVRPSPQDGPATKLSDNSEKDHGVKQDDVNDDITNDFLHGDWRRSDFNAFSQGFYSTNDGHLSFNSMNPLFTDNYVHNIFFGANWTFDNFNSHLGLLTTQDQASIIAVINLLETI